MHTMHTMRLSSADNVVTALRQLDFGTERYGRYHLIQLKTSRKIFYYCLLTVGYVSKLI